MTEWTWKFKDARVLNEGELTDVVKEVGYEATTTRDGQPITITGRVPLNAPDPANFKPFESLNEADLMAFINSRVQTEVYDRLATDLKDFYDRQAEQANQIKPLLFEDN